MESPDNQDNELNDFDVDDEDLADLLYDDDDAKPSKSKSSLLESPVKSDVDVLKTVGEFTSSPAKKKFNLRENFSLLEKKLEPKEDPIDVSGGGDATRSSFVSGTARDNKNKAASVVLSSPKSSPVVKPINPKSKLDDFLNEDSKYISDLDIADIGKKKTSPVKNSPKKFELPVAKSKPPIKMKDDVSFEDDDDGILDALDGGGSKVKDSPKSARGRSFMDELLGSPKQTAKSTPKKLSFLFDDKTSKADDEPKDESSSFSYVPSSARGRSGIAGRRQSSFFDEDKVNSQPKSLEDSPLLSKAFEPSKTFAAKSPGSAPAGGSSQPHSNARPRRDKSGDDDDWLGLLKSKKPDKPPQASSAIIPEKTKSADSPEKADLLGGRRKSSGAEWLGLKPSEIKNGDSPAKGIARASDFESKPEFPIAQESRKTDDDPGTGKQLPWLSSSAQMPWTSTKKDALSSPQKIMKQPDKQVDSLPQKRIQETPQLPGNTKLAQQPEPIANPTPYTHAYSEPVNAQGMPSVPQHVPLPPTVYQQVQAESLGNVVTTAVPDHQLVQSYHALNAELGAMKSLMSSLQFERDQLLRSADYSKKAHEEELKAVESSLKSQLKITEEAFERKSKSLKEEYEASIKKLEAQVKSLENERRDLIENGRSKIEKLDEEYSKEIGNLKKLHDEAVAMLKRDHADSLERLKRLKDQEIEAISSTQLHARSLQSLTDQLEMRATELAALQEKVEAKNQAAVLEKEQLLVTKEKDLKALEGRLRWQMEEGDQERTRLQQLVLRLESRLQQQTKEGEQDRWEVQQLKMKLEVHQKYLEEEKKMSMESIDREKEKIRLAQDSMLREQKAILFQLAQERQQLSSEKMELESLAKRIKGDETRLHVKKLQEESSIESQRRMLQSEEEKLHLEKDLLKQESQQIRAEKEMIQRERKQLKDERENIEDMKLELQRKMNEAENLARYASSEKEQGKSALVAAQRIEADHHSRLNQLTQQVETLMQREKQLLQEREKFLEEKASFEKSKDSVLCASCKLAVGLPITMLPPGVGQVRQSTPIFTVNPGISQQTNTDPNLMVWYITAQKDREYLQEELEFLHSLKEFGKKQ